MNMKATAKKTTEVAVQNEDLTSANQMPAYLQEQVGSTRGREEVGVEDLVIPRLEVVQALSPCRKKTDPAYIEGAEEGMLYNNVTRELYGSEVVVIPVFFRKEWLIWKDRKKGGGFRGAYPNEQEGKAALDELEGSEDFDLVDTGQQFCLIMKGNGKAEEIVVSMSKSKMKVSRKWNSLIRLANGDSFSRAYIIKAVPDKNTNGDEYHNIDVAIAGYPSQELYQRAERLYDQITSGKATIDRAVDPVEPGSDKKTEY